jgi:prepilin-type N-terminal cleavage/methylation domain-containing protein
MPEPGKSEISLKKSGFTLVELLIVSMIVVIIALAISYTLGSGVKVWQKINQELVEEDVSIFFDKFTVDLHNSLQYAGIKFVGDEQELELATLVNSQRFLGRLPGKIAYVYKSGSDTLSREPRDYSAVYNDEEGLVMPVLKNIQSLRFSYYFFDTQSKDYRWQEEWGKDDLPQAVRVELEIRDGERIKKFTRTVTIPVSS